MSIKPVFKTQAIGIYRVPRLLGFLAAAILFINPINSRAADRSWNASSGDWSTGSFWGGVEPIFSDNAYIQNGGTASINQSGETCNILYLGHSGTGTSGTVQMNGGSFTANSSMEIGNSGGTRNFTQSAGTNTVKGKIDIGIAGGTGFYNLDGPGALTAASEYIGYNNGTGTFTQSAGTNSMSLKYSENPYLYLGNTPNYNGYYYLSGSGQLTAPYEYISQGIFEQSGGTNNVAYLTISASSCSGTYNLTGGTLSVGSSITKGSGTTAFNFGGGTMQASEAFNTSLPMTLTGTNGNANVDTVTYTVGLYGILNGSGGLNKLGAGKLTLNALNTYSGDTIIKGGTLEIAHGIGASGTSLIDVQSGTATFKATPINKTSLNINTAALATFEVVNGAHTVGAISGSGITKVDAGAGLTAASINQGTLTIGSGATIIIQAIPGGPLGDAITPVPEPSAFVLLAGTFVIAIFAWSKKRIGPRP